MAQGKHRMSIDALNEMCAAKAEQKDSIVAMTAALDQLTTEVLEIKTLLQQLDFDQHGRLRVSDGGVL